jgi:predicted dithiol-disulfide oxidoreductase (DUF899 family)
MSLPEIVDKEEWRAARIELLAEEKAMTRARDALSAKRRMLPMVRAEKDYAFEGRGGPATLLDLFEGRSQLIVPALHVRPRLGRGLPELHRVVGRDVRRPAPASSRTRHQLRRGVASATS